MYINLFNVVLLILVLSACSIAQPPSSPTGTLPNLPVQTQLLESTATVVPISTSVVTKTIGTPVPGWENIPIMPGAYNSELEEDMVYLYSVQETVQDVEEYYLAKMKVNGWTLANRRVMAPNASGPSTVLDFQKDSKTLNVMLVDVPAESATTVLLMRPGE